MKNAKMFRRLSVLVVAVMLITVSVVSVSLAKFTNEYDVTTSVPTAKWEVDVNGVKTGSSTLSVADDMVPGVTKTFNIVIDNTGEVDATINLAENTESQASRPAGVSVTFSENDFELTPEADAKTITVTVAWEYDASNNDDMSYAAGTGFDIVVDITATQVNPGI